ncbi:hypothetical protein [Candidatus Enterococcus ferrettii]|uniref:Uncharacterized protein n=1 Tax=Candidatus Enterococcus ferrettii TaxID=2815324 RepID=A0ABV0ETG9_9ENTE|nr:hypothetical protein [Enterococcus sp. 665A]MBO1342198.1 hypothetical protein [Enterococcus sp. 665A]
MFKSLGDSIFTFPFILLAIAPVLILIGAIKSFKEKRMIQLFFILLFSILEIAILYMILFIFLLGRNS